MMKTGLDDEKKSRNKRANSSYFIDQRMKYKGGSIGDGDFQFVHHRINNSPFVVIKGK